MSIDWTKPVQTRDGRRVTILCTNAATVCGNEPQPVIGYIDLGAPMSWSLNGRFDPSRINSHLDLVNVPPSKLKKKVEVRLYRDYRGIYAVALCEGNVGAWNDDYIATATIEMKYEEQT